MENRLGQPVREEDSFRFRLIEYSIALTNYKVPLPLVYLLLVIESLQIISIGIVAPMNFSSFAYGYFEYVAEVLYPDLYLRTMGLVLYAIPLIFLFSVAHCLLLIYTIYKQSRLKIIVHYLLFLQVTVLNVPFLSITVSVLYCNASSPFSTYFVCYQGAHVLYLIMSSLAILWSFLCTLFVCLFYVCKDPLALGYFSTSSNLWLLAKFILKLAPVVYINIDPMLQYGVLYSVSYAGLNLVYFGAFKIMWPYNRKSKSLEYFIIRCEMIINFVVGFFIFLQFFSLEDPFNIVFVSSILMGVIFGEFAIKIFEFQNKILIQIYLRTEQEEEQVSESVYISFFRNFMGQIETKGSDVELLPILKLHEYECEQQQCPCQEIRKIYCKESKQDISKQLLYKFVNVLIKQAVIKTKKNNIELRLMETHIRFFRLNQKIKSIFSVCDLIQNDKVSLSEEIAIRRVFYHFRELNREQTEMNKFVEFSKHLWKFQRIAEQAIQNCQSFWNQLIQQDCEVTKAWKLASIVEDDKHELSQLVDKHLLKIFPKNRHILQTYSQLLRIVYRCPFNQIEPYLKELAMNSELCGDQFDTSGEMLFRENDQIAVLCASQRDGNFEYIRASSNIYQILDIRSVDLVGKNINTIMPEIYQDFHDTKVKQYLNQNDFQISERDSNVFALGGNGNVVSTHYRVKVIPSMKNGFQLACFLKKGADNNGQKYLLYFYNQNEEQAHELGYQIGDIIHIDPELKSMLHKQSDDEINSNYCAKIQQLLPEWDIQLQQMDCSKSNKYGSLFSKIQVAHQDKLDCGVIIKYLCFASIMEKPRLTIDAIDSAHIVIKLQQSDQALRESYWSQVSNSRLNLVQDTNSQSKNLNLMEIEGFGGQMKASVINLLGMIFTAIIVGLCVVSFKIGPELVKIEQQDFISMLIIDNVTITLFQTALSYQKSLNPYLMPTAISNSSVLDSIADQMKELYSINGMVNIDRNISVPIKVFKGNTLQNVISSSLQNAVNYLISACAYLIGDINDTNARLNLFENLESTYQGCVGVFSVDNLVTNSRLENLENIQLACDSLQYVLISLLAFPLLWRIFKVNQYSSLVLSLYQKTIDIVEMNELVQKCSVFMQKIKGSSLNIDNSEQPKVREKDLRILFKQMDYIVPPSEIISNQLEAIQQQDQLISLKEKITFQGGPSKIKHIAIVLLALVLWIAIRAIIRVQTHSSETTTERAAVIDHIQTQLKTNILMSRLLFNVALNDSSNSNVKVSLDDLYQILQINNIFNNARQSIDFQQIYATLAQIEMENSASEFQTFENVLTTNQEKLMDHIMEDIQDDEQVIIDRHSPGILVAGILTGVLTLFILWKVRVLQLHIYTGSLLMLNMIRQDCSKLKLANKTALVTHLPR